MKFRENVRITVLIVRGEREREKKIIKQTFWECVVNEKRNYYEKKTGFVREDLNINSKR
jgi:hypothetical protein